MRKKIFIVAVLYLIIWLVCFFFSHVLFVVLSITALLAVLAFVAFLALNRLVKKTNWWKNQFLGTEQFISNSGYRDNIIRNYDIVNLGSNPARYAFFYEGIKGQSWATGSQGQDMDFEILKFYYSYVKEGGGGSDSDNAVFCNNSIFEEASGLLGYTLLFKVRKNSRPFPSG